MKKPAIEDVLFACGQMSIAGGVFMIYVPAGLIAAGILLILTSTGIVKSEPKK
jgi:hypothetical protein